MFPVESRDILDRIVKRDKRTSALIIVVLLKIFLKDKLI